MCYAYSGKEDTFMFNTENLLRNEVFPAELPPCFSTDDLAANATLAIATSNSFGQGYSIPLTYSGYKSESSRRKFALPNPYHYCKAVDFIVKNESQIKAILEKSKYSLTAPIERQPRQEQPYDGNLTLDEYVLLIENNCWARSCKCDLPLPIDWKKVQTGIGLRIAEIKKAPPEGQLLFSTISETQRSNFTNEEWSAYELISKFALGDELIFYRNKKLYIDKIRELGSSAFMFIENKRYDVFDEEMATATAQAFSHENNAGKNQFISNFKNLWEIRIQSSDIRIEDSIKGFHSLKAYLQEVLAEVPQGKRDFSIVHTERFVIILNKLIDIYKEELSKREGFQDT